MTAARKKGPAKARAARVAVADGAGFRGRIFPVRREEIEDEPGDAFTPAGLGARYASANGVAVVSLETFPDHVTVAFCRFDTATQIGEAILIALEAQKGGR